MSSLSGSEGEESFKKQILLLLIEVYSGEKTIFQAISTALYTKFMSIAVVVSTLSCAIYGFFVWSPFLMGVSFAGLISACLTKFEKHVVVRKASALFGNAKQFAFTNAEKLALGIILLATFSKIYEKLNPQPKKESKNEIRSKIYDMFDLIFTALLIPMAYRLGVHRCQQVFQRTAGYLAMVMAAVNSVLIIKRTFFSDGSGVVDKAIQESKNQIDQIESKIMDVASIINVEEKKGSVILEGKKDSEKEMRKLSNWMSLRSIWGTEPRRADDRSGVGYQSQKEMMDELKKQKENEEMFSHYSFLATQNLSLAIAALIVITTVVLALIKYYKGKKIVTEGKGAKRARAARRGKKKKKLYTQSGGEVADPDYDQPMFIRDYDDKGKFVYVPWNGKREFDPSNDDMGWYAVFDDPDYNPLNFGGRIAKSDFEATIAGKKGFPVGMVEKSVGYCYTDVNRMCCTLIQGSVVTCAHILDGCADCPIKFVFGSLSFECRPTQGVSVGSDLLAFPIPSGYSLKSLKLAQATEGQECAVVTYKSEDENKCGHSYVTYGNVHSFTHQLYHTCTTDNGVCGSPIINTEGKVLAIHNSTTGAGANRINMGQFVVPNVEQVVLKHRKAVKEGTDEQKCITPNCDHSCGKFHEIVNKKPKIVRPRPCWAMKFHGKCDKGADCKFNHWCHRWCHDTNCLLKHPAEPVKEPIKEHDEKYNLNLQAPPQM